MSMMMTVNIFIIYHHHHQRVDDDDLDHQRRERVATRAGKDEARKRPRRWVAEDPGARVFKLALFIYIRVSDQVLEILNFAFFYIRVNLFHFA